MVVGRSMVVGRPLSMLFLKENATVTVCHTKTADLKAVCREADILVAAAGKAGMISGEFVKPGAVVADVGINVDENGALKGDVEWDGLEAAAARRHTGAWGRGFCDNGSAVPSSGGGGHAEIWSGTGAELSRLNKNLLEMAYWLQVIYFQEVFYVGNSGGADLGGAHEPSGRL